MTKLSTLTAAASAAFLLMAGSADGQAPQTGGATSTGPSTSAGPPARAGRPAGSGRRPNRLRRPAPLRRHPQHAYNAYWAYPTGPVLVRRSPRLHGHGVGRLHPATEDGLPEVYLVLGQTLGPSGRWWLKIRLPRRPNGSTGWVPAWALGPVHVVHQRLIVNRRTLRATLYRDNRSIWHTPIGVGKSSTPTPHGNFWVREKLVALRGNPIYGPYALGTSAYSRLTDWPGGGVVGIHGTNQPQLIPGRPSHGCIRMPNRAIIHLYRLISVGTPVTII